MKQKESEETVLSLFVWDIGSQHARLQVKHLFIQQLCFSIMNVGMQW